MTFMQFWELNQHLLYGDAKAAFRQYEDAERITLSGRYISPAPGIAAWDVNTGWAGAIVTTCARCGQHFPANTGPCGCGFRFETTSERVQS